MRTDLTREIPKIGRIGKNVIAATAKCSRNGNAISPLANANNRILQFPAESAETFTTGDRLREIEKPAESARSAALDESNLHKAARMATSFLVQSGTFKPARDLRQKRQTPLPSETGRAISKLRQEWQCLSHRFLVNRQSRQLSMRAIVKSGRNGNVARLQGNTVTSFTVYPLGAHGMLVASTRLR